MDLFTQLGLNTYEKNVYRCLISLDTATSRELCSETGVPYGRIYDVLRTLAEKGLISIIPTEPKTFKIIDPKIAIGNIINKQQEELQQLLVDFNQIKIQSKEKSPQTIILRGKEQQFEFVKHMHRTAKKEFYSISRNFDPDISYRTSLQQLIQRGVKLKIIIKAITTVNKWLIKELSANGAQFRIKELSGLRLFIKDKEEMILSIVDPKSNDRFSIYSTNKDFVISMVGFFEAMFSHCDKINL